MTRVPRVAGVILAAGSSTRMGRNKLLIDIEGESLIARAVHRALDAALDPVLVVVGHDAGRVRERIAGLSCLVVENPEYRSGQHTSLAAGFRALDDTLDAAIVILPDMPHVTTGMLATIAGRFRDTGARIVLSDYAGVQAPPTLYSQGLFDELRIASHGNGRPVIARHHDEAIVVEWPADRLADLDYPEDVHPSPNLSPEP